MLDLSLLLLALLQLHLPLVTTANQIHQVTVGIEGSFFSPQTVSAAQGDVVNFIFGGDIHDITQSTPENPCSPLPGGFSSGLLGKPRDSSDPIVVFSLTVTDASAPIWYFCAATIPASHCNHEMVGVINPPSQAAFMSFADAARLATTTSFVRTMANNIFQVSPADGQLQYNASLVLSGHGATATLTTLDDADSALLTPSIITPAPTSSFIQTSSPSATATSSPSSRSSKAAVIGGAVGAAAGAFLLLCIGYFLWRRVRKQRRLSAGSQFFAYNHPRGQSVFAPASPPATAISTINYNSGFSPNMTTTFDGDRETQQLMSWQSPPPKRATKPAPPMTSEYSHLQSNVGSPLQPTRNLSHTTSAGQLTQTSGVGPMYSSHHNHEPLPSIFTNTEEPNVIIQRQPAEASSSTGSDSGAPFDVKALAREVATLIRQDRAATKESVGERVQEQLGSLPSATDSLQSAPPRYHTVENSRED